MPDIKNNCIILTSYQTKPKFLINKFISLFATIMMFFYI